MAVKASLRKIIRQRLAAMSPTVAQAKSMAICKRLLEQPEFERAQTIMIYLPMPGEVDVAPIALRGWQMDKTIAAPRLAWDLRYMLPVEIRSLESGLVVTRPGLREPEGGEPIPLGMLDMVLVPAMAYDRQGNRLGRGAGFYDRFLASPQFRGVPVGLAFTEQLVDHVPVHDTDMPVQLLITDEDVMRFAPAGSAGAGKEAGGQR